MKYWICNSYVLYCKKMFNILLKLQLVSLLFFLPVFLLYTDMRDSTKILNRCLNVRRHMKILLRRTLRADWINYNWTHQLDRLDPLKDVVSEKKIIYNLKSSCLHWVQMFLFFKYSLFQLLKHLISTLCGTHSFFKYNWSQHSNIENVC